MRPRRNNLVPLLFIAADHREIEPWVAHWDNVHAPKLSVQWARTGQWRSRDVIAIANGVGAKRAAAGIAAARTIAASFSGICSVGTCGALDPSLAIADVVIATALTDGETEWAALDPHGPSAHSGLVRSSAHIARTADEKTKLRQSGAIIVEMEAAGVARMAQELAAPFYCIRVVSDLAEETFFLDFESFLMLDGRFNIPKLVMKAMVHPTKAFPELLRLQRRTALAAKELGNFLTQCDFRYD